ncbi:hypothetical protein [Fusibacter ferrireducens]|uniref:Uncharacterized protein n=1 Tax=Fusibacter ferrireducens TaxID=2785058 RepID=A0ABR9ZPD0_9FIRM|nr:hypothetical protein [Fusibacter ferrireducens]MBF4691983.1 hypothetical protein [Fusibacter ferrireducens]
MKTNKKRLSMYLLIILLLVMVLRLAGFIDLNWYMVQTQGDQMGSFGKTSEQKSYQINFEYDNEIIHKHTIVSDGQEPMVITAKIDPYIYEGNYFMPLYKDFTMQYTCTFTTSSDEPEDGITEKPLLQGRVEGTIKTKITGLCTMKKGKTLVTEKALNTITDYVIKTLSH